jgi:adenosylcobalamin-dependent ribonucleoside-triphosphate reductase
MSEKKFTLSPTFVADYADRKPPFGFNGLGELVYLRTYSRFKADGTQEQWHETVQRVVEGCYNMQRRWITQHNLGWSDRKAQRSAQEMYDRIWNMKFLPPGRGLWAMGTALTDEKDLAAALNNCAFVSTDNLAKDLAEPFVFLMDASMLGIGVGFDTKGAGSLTIRRPSLDNGVAVFTIPDTREGWVESVEKLLLSYFVAGSQIAGFDYSLIRPAGSPIKGFGGVASGAEPLEKLHTEIREVLDRCDGQPISVTNIVDIMNLIGKCVVAGNVRRTAEIAFGDKDSEEFLDLKNYEVNPHRAEFGWTSNNSIFAEIGQDYRASAQRVALNGEPGYVWLENMRAYSRMGEAPDHKDKRVAGANPCVEQSLESYELCNLVETFPANHTDLDDYKRTLKYAYLFAKTVTLGKTPWAKTNRVLLRNRRIGLSQSGIQQAIAKIGIEAYRQWCVEGYATVRHYDEVYSEWLAIPKSIKVTSVKPSGSVSLLAGATPGIHWPESTTYIRRMRLSKHSDLINPLIMAGYKLEPAVGSEDSTLVVEIPVKIEEDIRTAAAVSMWEQLAMAAFMQKYWADNQVSATITFDPATEGTQIGHALDYFQYQLKGVSFLPRYDYGAYPQMPYEAISEETYQARLAEITPVSFGSTHEEAVQEKYCDSSGCVI